MQPPFIFLHNPIFVRHWINITPAMEKVKSSPKVWTFHLRIPLLIISMLCSFSIPCVFITENLCPCTYPLSSIMIIGSTLTNNSFCFCPVNKAKQKDNDTCEQQGVWSTRGWPLHWGLNLITLLEPLCAYSMKFGLQKMWRVDSTALVPLAG